MKISAYMNHGRWLVTCPKHPGGGVMPAEKTYICPVCYPGIIARLTVVRNGKIAVIPDASAQRNARQMAVQNGEVYDVEFPDLAKIEALTNKRRLEHRNWNGETLNMLREANKSMGVK